MDERIARLKTPEECDQFIRNVEHRLPYLALAARQRAIELRAANKAATGGITTAAEREAPSLPTLSAGSTSASTRA